MKKTVIMLCILIAVTGMVGCASKGKGPSYESFNDFYNNFDDVDNNHDNRISRDEWDSVNSFDARDKNGDGSIDHDEFSGGHGGGGHGR